MKSHSKISEIHLPGIFTVTKKFLQSGGFVGILVEFGSKIFESIRNES